MIGIIYQINLVVLIVDVPLYKNWIEFVLLNIYYIMEVFTNKKLRQQPYDKFFKDIYHRILEVASSGKYNFDFIIQNEDYKYKIINDIKKYFPEIEIKKNHTNLTHLRGADNEKHKILLSWQEFNFKNLVKEDFWNLEKNYYIY